MIRLDRDLPTDPYDDLAQAAAALGLDELAARLGELGVPAPRLVPRTTIEPAELREREQRATDRPQPDRERDPAGAEDPANPEASVSLTRYWLVELTDSPLDPAEVAVAFEGVRSVELAYTELPVINAGGADVAAAQAPGPSHLDPSPVGSNIRWAWHRDHYGAGVRVLDVESGWQFGHEALNPLGVQVVGGVNQDGVGTFRGGHGTAALGVVAGTFVAPQGVHGACPKATVLAASPFNGVAPVRPLPDVLTAALLSLAPGDVVLIEVAALEGGTTTRYQRPIERQPDVRAAIRLLTGAGIVVIEPAGNGNSDLDALAVSATRCPLTPGAPGYLDSGAVLVGGASVDATQPAPPKRWVSTDTPGVGSNFGRRVDCCSWARRVWTSGAGPWSKPSTTAYQNLNGTSSASAIIAGVAVLVQALQSAAGRPPLTSRELRAAFRDAGTGTAAALGAQIGAMPDLELVAKHLGI